MTTPDPADLPASRVALDFVRALHERRPADAALLVSPEVPEGAMSPEVLDSVWTRLTDRLGALAELRPASVSEEEGRVVAQVVARMARSELVLRVVLDSARRVVGFWVAPPRSPAYEPPRYVERERFEEIELVVGREPSLPAVLSRPAGTERCPIVVLVHGSGPNDRDETLGANRPFRDVAWGLATRGIAVLRYDKRTFAHPGALTGRVTVEEEVIADALDALGAARAAPGADPARVVLLGHSLGARLAPEIARRDGGVRGVAMLAPAARAAHAVLADQLSHVDAADRAGGGGGIPELASIAALLERLGRRELDPGVDVLGAPAAYWYDLEDRPHLEYARALDVPLLLLFGGRDYQVTADDMRVWRDALAGRTSADVRAYAQLNHLFMPGEGMATPEEYAMSASHVSAEVIDDLAAWVHSLGATPTPGD